MKVLKILLLCSVIFLTFYYINQIREDNRTPQTAAPTGVVSNNEVYALPSFSSQDTASWKTYHSNKYQFSFSYPADYSVKEIEVNFPGGLRPFISITDPNSNLKLDLDVKIEFGTTEQGFSFVKYPSLKSKPQLIRNFSGGTWIYWKRFPDGSCIDFDSSNIRTIKDGENNMYCYDVNFPYNWYLSIYGDQINTNNSVTEKALNNFDKIVTTLKY